ncbi:MAG TPA: hypothetical protein VF885_00325 [Arthrobacter sp.]
MAVVFAAPLQPPAPPINWVGLDMQWIGWDGSVWSLSTSADGTVMMPGVRGLAMPPVIHHRAAHASLPGARWRSSTIDVREVFWPLQVYTNAGSEEWVLKDRAFWNTMHPAKLGTWVVTHPGGTQRKLKLRFMNDGEGSFTHDSILEGWNNYGITLAAEQPFWEGESVSKTFTKAGTEAPFFTGGGGPAFTISPGDTLPTASIANPGDVEAWPVWRITGPVTSTSVGVNGRSISLPFTIAAGDVVEVNTDPGAQTAMKGTVGGPLSADWTSQLGSIDFAPVPPGASATLNLAIEGTGTIECTINARYYRAW